MQNAANVPGTRFGAVFAPLLPCPCRLIDVFSHVSCPVSCRVVSSPMIQLFVADKSNNAMLFGGVGYASGTTSSVCSTLYLSHAPHLTARALQMICGT